MYYYSNIKHKNLKYLKMRCNIIINHDQRNKFIRNLALDLKGNTLILYARVEGHGRVIYDMINSNVLEQREVFFVHGGVAAEEREKVREITETQNNAIIIASYGTFSTGINIKNLHNVIFASHQNLEYEIYSQ